MCGLCGIVDLDGGADAAVSARMADALAHRGPDDRGSFSDKHVSLEHLRLSIIDLSPLGHQPMAARDGNVQMVFNGEIYNYRELREELRGRGHTFRSESDSEVLLAAYLEWGQGCVDHLRGMWAFAIWDAASRRLFCSVDRFGIKPLYYRHDGRRFLFASEPKAFRAASPTLGANLASVADYLRFGVVDHGADTFFAGVHRLPAAHFLSFDESGLAVKRYWQLPAAGTRPADPPAAVRERFFESVALHLRSDVALGTCLSGGIDSSAVACTVAQLLSTSTDAAAVGPRQRTFTAYFEQAGYDERPFARAVVAATGSEPHWVTFDEQSLVDDLPAIVHTQDEPFGSSSIVAQWYVMQAAAESGLKVMLDGQGGDELFAGYTTSYGPFLADLLLHGRLGRLRGEARAFAAMPGIGGRGLARALTRGLASPGLVRRLQARESGSTLLAGERIRSAPRAPLPQLPGGGSPLRRQLADLVTRSQLPELLRYEDRNSMAHSIEARVPMLDHPLVELAFSLDPRDLIENGTTKSVLRRAVGDLLPAEVTARRDKLGFVTPLQRWWGGRLGEYAREVFSSPECRDRAFLDTTACLERLDEAAAGRPTGFELWRALNLELWARSFGI